MMKKRRNSAQKATMGPKTQADLAGIKFQNVRKLKNASIALAPTALILKKVRHVGQRHREGAHFDLVNPYHADFDFSDSLCRI